MPKIDFGKTVQLNRLFSIINRKKFNFTEDIVWRLLVARNLANIYSELHKLGYYVIDTKPANLRTYKQAQGVCILDCDGFKLEGSSIREMITLTTLHLKILAQVLRIWARNKTCTP